MTRNGTEEGGRKEKRTLTAPSLLNKERAHSNATYYVRFLCTCFVISLCCYALMWLFAISFVHTQYLYIFPSIARPSTSPAPSAPLWYYRNTMIWWWSWRSSIKINHFSNTPLPILSCPSSSGCRIARPRSIPVYQTSPACPATHGSIHPLSITSRCIPAFVLVDVVPWPINNNELSITELKSNPLFPLILLRLLLLLLIPSEGGICKDYQSKVI